MAVNVRQGGLGDPLNRVGMVVTVPATNTTTGVPASGTPCLAGNIPGIAEGGVDAVTGITVLLTNCIAEVSVKAIDNSGESGADANLKVDAGDRLYMGADGVISKRADGVLFGTAFGNSLANALGTDTRTGQLVAAGATATIRVWVGKIN